MNKIIHNCYIQSLGVLFFLTVPFNNHAQVNGLNKYGLLVISSDTGYLNSVAKDAGKEMVDLEKLIPALVLDLRYATTNNFMKIKLYPPLKTTFLRKPAAIALSAVQNELNSQGLALKIFDAYRPYSVTEKMWEPVKDDRYAADPKTGSGHNRGIAVDLTLIDLKTKQELNMGTGFDNFSDTAHHNFAGLPKEMLQNRLLLRAIMEKNGFRALETEWWHYAFTNGVVYELLDLKFEQLLITHKSNTVPLRL